MEQVVNCPGAKLLYTGILRGIHHANFLLDTDSIICKSLRDSVPLQTGDMLGQMQEEWTEYDIVEFVCGGAKVGGQCW